MRRFSEILELAQQQQQQYSSSCSSSCSAATSHLYLAQQSLLSGGLSGLLDDIDTPPVLQGKQLSDINLWMSVGSSRSSLHYDPYQNLLCVVAGSKTVTLFSPAATPGLYPRPLYGESSNHSKVDFAADEHNTHPLYR
eukprot:jgi/Chrzof1/5875/Cz16g19010.t1